jgi:fructan beta-fructosidase
VNINQPWWWLAHSSVGCLLGLIILMAAGISLLAQDILINDFEATNYGAWTTTGTAFGSRPVVGTLSGQNPVTGYEGSRLVNTFLGGDVSTGTLTSPPFIIQRNYIRFLIGGGSQRGKTCMNLLVNGQVVRTSVGMGDREDLGPLQWNVSNLISSNATIQIVDAATGTWGHINVDQIVQTDTSLGSVVTITNRYLCIPVKTGATRRLFELVVDGLVTHEFFVELADTVTPDFYSFLDLTNFQGKQALVRVDSALATTTNFNSLIWSDGIVGASTFYQEANRPIYHYTARRGWLNDPNGLVYFNGEYHMGYQHNPYGWTWANMHWGHAVSTDLVHWTELPEWLYPDPLGAEWSGSAVVDWNNSAGFGTNALVAFFTGAAKTSDPNLPRMAVPGQFQQCMAYSLDSGRTWTKYANNPVLANILGGDNRDPKVFWYGPGNQWVMALWLINNDYGIFSSTNLRSWTQTSTFTFPGVMERPDMFQLPLDGNGANPKWIFWGGGGNYYIGTFDGSTFTGQTGPFTLRNGDCFAVAQTFNNIPGDARRIIIVHGTAQFPGMPFNNDLNFPMELSLRTSPSGARLYANPVPELALLRTSTINWPAQSLVAGSNVLAGTFGEAFELDAKFQPGPATNVTFNLRGTAITYDCVAQAVACNEVAQPLAPSNGVVHLHMLVDRGIIEIFGNDGLLYMPMRVTATAGAQPVSLIANGNGAMLNSVMKHDLGSAWNSSAAPPAPTIITQPIPQTVNLGGPASFNVTVAGVAPFFYQWCNNGRPITGATNSMLTIFPANGTNSNYDVVVTNAGGAVTSSVAPLTIRAPYKISFWRMESQVLTPNTSGIPVFTGVFDAETAAGQGVASLGVLSAAEDDLITFSGLSGSPLTLSNSVPPAAMFVNGNSGGAKSYNAAVIVAVDGALFFPQDVYGNEFSFNSPFTIEFFFKTHGNQSGAGSMELVVQGENAFRYGIVVNEAGPGSVRFALNNGSAIQLADLTSANYADGQWHYLQAIYDTISPTNGQMRLMIVNQDGTEDSTTNTLTSGFGPLPAGNDGNLFLGRNTYSHGLDPRTFIGLMDEVQITAGVVPDWWRLGKISSVDSHLRINGVLLGTNGVSFQWTGAASNNFVIQRVAQLGDVWQAVATLPSADGVSGYVDTNASRLSRPASFYRILSQ